MRGGFHMHLIDRPIVNFKYHSSGGDVLGFFRTGEARANGAFVTKRTCRNERVGWRRVSPGDLGRHSVGC